jgi:hypothetical protein
MNRQCSRFKFLVASFVCLDGALVLLEPTRAVLNDDAGVV